jgi:tRNA-Thr(GGU) m(6)t(6)A37 methyltransferase TsaA
MSGAFFFTPVGVIKTPFLDRVSAPRQPRAAGGARGTVELFAGHGFEHALSDLEGFDRIWIIFWFHLNEGAWRPKVLPPRSANKRRGVFATRSPHRPNPIGLSAVTLECIDGLVLHVRDVDMISGTPVLDIKPYVPYADSHPDARTGWLAADPLPEFEVVWSKRAREEVEWLHAHFAIDLTPPVERVLALGPQPHPYRRIRRDSDAMLLAVKDWRIRFAVEGRMLRVLGIRTGYRPRDLALSEDPAVVPHRAFCAQFGADCTHAPP